MRPSEAARLERALLDVLQAGAGADADFYLSALTEHNPFYSTEEVAGWLRSLNATPPLSVDRVPLEELDGWLFDPDTEDLRHRTGGFFSIRGLHVQTNVGPIPEWTQPIIEQPECGILGMVTRKIGGILYFLVQAKAEPGNRPLFQLSPTVQATRSNYTRLHGGRPTPFLEYFLGHDGAAVLVDQLQSEQGARFFQKRNRNVIVRVRDDEELKPGPLFRWLTLGQLHRLIRMDNAVNMDTRSVISCICLDPSYKRTLKPVAPKALRRLLDASPLIESPVSELGLQLLVSAHTNSKPLMPMERLVMRMTERKFLAELRARLIPLKEVRGWVRTREQIRHERDLYFSVIGVRVQGDGREVGSWCQPIVQQRDVGLVAFVMRPIEGVLHFLVQLKLECGNMDILEMAPTVQCVTGSYKVGALPRFVDEIEETRRLRVISDTMQSEEGGRFYQESNRNVLLLAGEDFPQEQPPAYLWMTLWELQRFIRFANFLNVEARSLLSGLSMV